MTRIKKIDKPCHSGLVEVVRNLYAGTLNEIEIGARDYRIKVIIPLANLHAEVWETGWRGQILGCPIEDGGNLPPDVESTLVDKIIRLTKRQRVAIGCMGGHGRTGYVLALVVGKLQPEIDPIVWLRANYCKQAIETWEQIKAIATFLNKPELLTHKGSHEFLAPTLPWYADYKERFPKLWNELLYGTRDNDGENDNE